MKRLELKITDQAFANIREVLVARRLGGETWGLPEQALMLILDAIKVGATNKTIRAANDPEAPGPPPKKLADEDLDKGTRPMSKRYNVFLGESTFRVGGKTIRFRPKGKVVCHDDPTTAEEAVRKRYGAGGFSASFLVGLNVGEEAKYTVDDVVQTIIEIRKQQGAGPDASVLSQRGIYEDKKSRTIVEDSVRIIIIDLAGLPKNEFVEQMLKLAEHLLEKFEQESVIVEIQRRGVVVDVYGITP